MLQSYSLVERNWVLGLLLFVALDSIVLTQVIPSISPAIIISIYVAALFSALTIASRHHKRVVPNFSDSPPPELASVFIVVPAHNEEAVIGKTVETLLQLEYPDFQLMVIDDRSTDSTPQILKKLAQLHPQKLRIYSRQTGSKGGKAAALNEVLPLVTADIFAVFDADTIVAPDFLQHVLPYFADTQVAAVQAQKCLLNAHENFFTQCQDYEYLIDAYFQTARDRIVGAVELRGNGMFIRTTPLKTFGGFNECNLTEDLDLSTQFHVNGIDVRYAVDAQVFEECPSKLVPLLQQRIRWVEGSLIRYFEYASKIFLSPLTSFRTKLDCFLFVFQFIAPMWLLIESLCVFARVVSNQSTLYPVFYAATALIVLSLYFLYAACRSLMHFRKVNLLQALGSALMVNIYLSALFPLIVAYLTLSMLCRRERNLKWTKIHHYGALTK